MIQSWLYAQSGAAFIPFVVASIVLRATGIFGATTAIIPMLRFVGAIVFIKLLVDKRRSQHELEEEMKTWGKDDHK